VDTAPGVPDDHAQTGTGWPGTPPEPDGGPDPGSGPDPAGTPPPGTDAAVAGPPGDPVPAPRRRLSAAGAVIGLLLGLLGFALVAQVKSNGQDPQLSSARPEDLVRILSDLDARKDRLNQEIANLQFTQQQLAAGSQGREAALAAATQRANELGILAGTLAASGPGITVRFLPGNAGLSASYILDAVEELRDAGAEAMQIDGANGVSVRIVASSYFVDDAGGRLRVDGQVLSAPYTITVIGDPPTLQPALNIAGGVVESVVHKAGGNVVVQTPGTVEVTTTVVVGTPQYARPVK